MVANHRNNCYNFSVKVTLKRKTKMYFDYVVAIPSEKGKIITKKKGSATYVLYRYGQVYMPDKKYAIPWRTVIGKVSLESSDIMFLNERKDQ